MTGTGISNETDFDALAVVDDCIKTPAEKPLVSERLRKLCAWAIITALDYHPHKEGMLPTLAFQIGDETTYQLEKDPTMYESAADLLARTQLWLAERDDITAYVLMFDSIEELPDCPTQRPLDETGIPYALEQPTLFAYAGERDTKEGLLVIQCYSSRMIRAGAKPLGAPLITYGPDSLLVEPCVACEQQG